MYTALFGRKCSLYRRCRRKTTEDYNADTAVERLCYCECISCSDGGPHSDTFSESRAYPAVSRPLSLSSSRVPVTLQCTERVHRHTARNFNVSSRSIVISLPARSSPNFVPPPVSLLPSVHSPFHHIVLVSAAAAIHCLNEWPTETACCQAAERRHREIERKNQYFLSNKYT